jgi:hypothetical protein
MIACSTVSNSPNVGNERHHDLRPWVLLVRPMHCLKHAQVTLTLLAE